MAASSASSEVSYPCRLLGHKWDIYIPANPVRYGLYLRCARCHMRRHDVYDAQGTLGPRRYLDAPEGYYLGKGETRPAIEDLRKWAMRRQNRIIARQSQGTE